MLFNSFVFIFGFLPAALAVFYFAQRLGGARAALAWLTVASLFFYGWWNPVYLLLLVGSIGFNFMLGLWLSKPGSPRLLLAVGIGFNLSLLGYFKYAGFFAENSRAVIGVDPTAEGIVLPLAISFFTFQQIAYLVDTHKGRGGERSFLRYCTFVSFFPQLIAGPIVHHREMLPQLISSRLGNLTARTLAIGGTIFILGLGKKVILADSLAGSADPIFDAAADGVTLTLLEAWSGVLAYTFQIYFDFSGYSDMAIGLAYMFGLRIPINFDSPYKSGSLIDFWSRWHITLSRFLRNYLYIPLGGNRKGEGRRYANLMVVMLLGGLWHGAGWTFVAWGSLHGSFLVVNHAWVRLRGRYPKVWALPPFTGHALTLLAVVVAWVFFRSDSFETAFQVLAAMSGLNGTSLSGWLPLHVSMIGLAAFIALALPDIQEIMGRFSPALVQPPSYRGWLAKPLHRNKISKYWEIFFSPRGFENTFTFQEDGSITKKGRSWTDLSEEVRLAEVEKRVLSTGYRPGEAPEATRAARSYQRILENLTSRGAEVCMVGMPLTKLMRDSMEEIPEFEGARLLLRSLAAKYGVRYVDMSAAITNEELFFDAEHLNEAGAHAFAPLLEAACFGNAPAKAP